MDKFIIFSPARSGSTVVGLSLFSHPEVLYFGELFNDHLDRRIEEASHKTCGRYVKIKSLYQFRYCTFNGDGYEYLSDFYSQDVPFKLIGFKLINHHLPLGRQDDVWNYLTEHTEIKIIYMQRENMLEKVCSRIRMGKIGHVHIDKQIDAIPFMILENELEKEIKLLEMVHPAMHKILKSHQVFQVEYGQICSDFQGCMRGVFEFLGVSSDIKMKPKLTKIATLSPNEEILNYQELKTHFMETKYGKYFIY